MANLKKKTRKRTRKFEIDGVIVTTTTSKVRLSRIFILMKTMQSVTSFIRIEGIEVKRLK